MNSFKQFVAEVFNPHFNKKTGEARKHRYMANVIPDVSTHTATGGKTVPEYCKADNNEVQAFVSLSNPGITTGEKIITKLEASKLMKKFNITTGSGKLGNTGIHIGPHPTKPGVYILRK